MVARIEMIGRRFGRLTVTKEVSSKRKPSGSLQRMFQCRCKCGRKIIVRGEDLRSDNTRSCGCLQVDSVIKKNHKHGLTPRHKIKHGKWPPLYRVWSKMRQRCNDPKDKSYKDYGGRGIKVCKRWSDGEGDLSGYECFIRDVGERPSQKHSIDRYPDNDGDYGPHNFRWATRFQQNTNQRRKTPRLVSAGVMVLP